MWRQFESTSLVDVEDILSFQINLISPEPSLMVLSGELRNLPIFLFSSHPMQPEVMRDVHGLSK